MRSRTPHSQTEPPLLQRRRVKFSAKLPLTIKVLTSQGAIDDVTLAFSQDKNFWCEIYARELHPNQERAILDWFKAFASKEPTSTQSLRLNFAPLSPFTAIALRAIGQIPFGQTATYSDIAEAIDNPKAMRAIGGACHHNPFPVIIPCHRITAKKDIGGFAYPLEMKKLLLEFES